MKKRILTLGAGIDQVELIKALHKKDCKVYAVDKNPNAPGSKIADCFFPVDTMNKSEIIDIVKKNYIEQLAVVSTEQPLIVASEISEELGLFFPINRQQAIQVTNKSEMKILMEQHNVPTPQYKISTSLKEFHRNIRDFKHPIIIKPIDSSGSRGVELYTGTEDLDSIWKQSVKYSSSEKCISETYLRGTEISVDVIVIDEKINILMVSENLTVQIKNNAGLVIFSIFPAKFSTKINRDIELSISKLCKALRLKTSLFFTQMIISNENAYVIEFSARNLGGSKINFLKMAKKIDIMDIYAKIILREKIEFNNKHFSAQQYITLVYLFTKPGIISSLSKLDDLKSQNIIFDYITYLGVGTKIKEINSRAERIGVAILLDDNKNSLQEKIITFIREFEILNESGNDIFYRELYMEKMLN
jgi:phosphoribosylamine-glycine ligase